MNKKEQKEQSECLLDADLTAKIQQSLLKLESEHDRVEVIYRLRQFVTHLESVQLMQQKNRFVFWECAYNLYDYLRRNGQLKRQVNEFAPRIKELLRKLLAM